MRTYKELLIAIELFVKNTICRDTDDIDHWKTLGVSTRHPENNIFHVLLKGEPYSKVINSSYRLCAKFLHNAGKTSSTLTVSFYERPFKEGDEVLRLTYELHPKNPTNDLIVFTDPKNPDTGERVELPIDTSFDAVDLSFGYWNEIRKDLSEHVERVLSEHVVDIDTDLVYGDGRSLTSNSGSICIQHPIERFKNVDEMIACAKEWEKIMMLDNWSIKYELLDSLMDNDDEPIGGVCRRDPIYQAAHIKLHRDVTKDPKFDEDFPHGNTIRYNHEHILVHEMCHISVDVFSSVPRNTIENAFYMDNGSHRLVEVMTRSLLMARYGLTIDWFRYDSV